MKNKKVITALLIIVFVSGLIVILFPLLKNIRGQNLPKENKSSVQLQDPNTLRKLSNGETANWKGKTTDWLGRTFDVNNAGKEFEGKDLKMISSTGWTIPDEPNTIDKGDLVKVEMVENNNWDSYPKAKNILNEADLSTVQKQYFYDNNYVPRSVEHFDVTGDGISETAVTSLTLGCGRCVDFYITIFTGEGKYIAIINQGTLLKTENGNGFYLINYDWSSKRTIINISKYKWDKSLFTEVARKEIVLNPK